MSNTMEAGRAGASGQVYTLTVLNKNSDFQHFALFQSYPQLVGTSLNSVSLAWILGSAAPGSPDNPSQSQFSWMVNYSAVAGYIQQQGTIVSPRRFVTQANTSIGTDTNNNLGVTYKGLFPQGAPAFPSALTTGTPGLAKITSDNTIPENQQQDSNHSMLSLGLAMDNRTAVAVQLLPNLSYEFTLKPTYHIVATSLVQGQIIDFDATSRAFQFHYDGTTDQTVIFTPQCTFVLRN